MTRHPATCFAIGPRDRGKRLDRFLHERIPGLSRTRIQRAIRQRVTLSWSARPRPATAVRPGGEVWLAHRVVDETPLSIELSILARGAGWLAVDKPAGLAVHPVHRTVENTLIRILRRQEGDAELRLAHRLDRETSGVLLVCRDCSSARALSRAFVDGAVRKVYLALVAGIVVPERGRITLPIGAALGSRVRERLAAGHGKPARTDWRVLRRMGDRTLLRLAPRTGRRHQLRVHLEAIGHPILGDLLYGWPEEDYLRRSRGEGDARRAGSGPRRQLLHCARMEFPEPCGSGRRRVTAPLPPDFRAALG